MTSSLTPAGSTRRWRRLRRFVLDRDGWRCRLLVDEHGQHVEDGDPAAAGSCGAFASHVDHVVGRRYADAAGLVELPSGRRAHVDAPSNLRASCAVGNLGRPRSSAERSTRPGPNVAGRRWSW